MIPAWRRKRESLCALALCLALWLLVFPATATALTPAGTVIGHSFTVRLHNPTQAREIPSNQARVTVKDMTDPALAPPRTAVTTAGKAVDFVHTITNRGNADDSFTLKAVLMQGTTPDDDPPPKIEFLAADGKTLLATDGAGAPVIGPVAPGASVGLVLRVTPAAGSEGCVENIVVTATSVSFPARSSALTDQMAVPALLSAPVKSVAPSGSVVPGSVLTYAIAVAGGALPVSGVKVTDTLDPALEYLEGSATVPSAPGGSVSWDAVSRTLSYSIPALPAAYNGTLTFQARVRGDARGGSYIFNTAGISSDASGASLPSNRTVTMVEASPLRITKIAGSAVAEAGDLVPYTVRVENGSAQALTRVSVFDAMPNGFRYLKGSSVLNGTPIADPIGAGGQVRWDLGNLEPAAVRVLSYRCAVSGDATAGIKVNSAMASGTGPTGATFNSPPASAGVKVRSSLLGDKAVILGRLFEDRNDNAVPDSGEPGLPGVRVYLEDGSYVFTDREGQYSFTGVASGEHVVKIDRSTLPPRYDPVPYDTSFAGVGWSQFITVPFGGPARGDFALKLNPRAAAAVPPSTDPAASQANPSAPLSDRKAPARLRVTPERLDMPADARSVVPFTVQLLDQDGKRIAGSGTVTVATGKGELVDPDADAAQPGHQVRVVDGVGVFRVRSTNRSGQDRVVVLGENGTSAAVDLYFNPRLSDWILVGLGNLTVGHRSVSGHIEKIGKEDRFDEGIFHDERLAFFTRGKILGKYLLTAAYDSGKEKRDGVFQVIDPEKYYPVYGDASDIGYEAQSRGKIYLKIESGRSYLLAGDYRTDLSENEFSRYDRALNGVKVEANTEHLQVKGFESRTEETVVKDEIPGNGSSGHYFLSRRPVFENSERVRIEVRDRYHSERVITVTEKLRYADYSIDYNAGTILFKEPVPSLDQNLNPVTIVVNYQSQQVGKEHYVYGGRALLKSVTGSYLGATAVVEEGTGKDTTLYGLDAGLKIGERLSLKGEGALSDTPEKGRGKAWKVELTARPLDPLLLGGYYRKVDADFSNRSMTGNEYGTEKYGARLDYRGLSDTLLFAESFVQRDEVTGARQFGNQAGFLRKFSLFEGEGGFKRIEEDKFGVDGHSDLLYAGAKAALTPRLDATLRRDQLLSPSSVREYQSRTFLKLDYRVTDSTRAFVTEEYQEGSPNMRQATRFGVESVLSPRMRLTTGYQFSSGVSGTTEQSSVDLNTRLVDRDGLMLESRSGYQIERALSQERGQAILGLNSRLRAAEGLYLNTTFERVQTVQGNSGTRTAFTLAGEYLRLRNLKLTGRYEIRSGPGETASLYGAGLGYKLSDAVTLLGKGTYWDNDLSAGHDRLLDGYLGASFRPLADNPLQVLSLVRYKMEEKGSVPGYGENRSLVLSTEPSYRVKRWNLQGKYAGKFFWSEASGRGFQSYTDLILAGVSYDIASRWELSAYLKLTNQYDTGQHSLGSVASAGYRVYRNVIAYAGYNYARLDDRDLTGETYQGQGPFIGVKVKFDEQMFEQVEAETPLPAPRPPVAAEMPQPVPRPVAPPALFVAALKVEEPLRLSGSAELLTLLVNGEPARLPSTAVTVTRERLESVHLQGGRLASPLDFVATVEKPELVRSWTLQILDGDGKVVRSIKGSGSPAGRITWAGDTEGEGLKKGAIYQYQLQVAYLDGSTFRTGRELFGVDRRDALLLTLAGGAFVFDHAELSPEARRVLKGAARILRAHPQERVIVEGHTDFVGTHDYNIGLSERRCNSAVAYLVHEEKIAPSRITRRWYGKTRPIADNETAEGRSMNRRIELKGHFLDSIPISPDDRYRSKPYLTINGRNIPVDAQGRFETSVPPETEKLDVEMGDSLGRSLATTLAVPALRLAEPAGENLVRYGSAAGGIKVDREGAASCSLTGGVDPATVVEVDGKAVQADETGRFAAELPLGKGEQVYGIVVRNGSGCSKLINLRVNATVREPAEERLEP